ncbi:hypothetical protein AGMMS49959_19460 [Planctomycetales bacterium]|nr:hypothetical protein AGMMS49959_19460 [Planctomycetales bacterium]
MDGKILKNTPESAPPDDPPTSDFRLAELLELWSRLQEKKRDVILKLVRHAAAQPANVSDALSEEMDNE